MTRQQGMPRQKARPKSCPDLHNVKDEIRVGFARAGKMAEKIRSTFFATSRPFDFHLWGKIRGMHCLWRTLIAKRAPHRPARSPGKKNSSPLHQSTIAES